MKHLLFLFLLPLFGASQTLMPVQPILSPDYSTQLDSLKKTAKDVIGKDSSIISLLLRKKISSYEKPRKIIVADGYAKLLPYTSMRVYLSGQYNASASYSTINRVPALQNNFVQGQSINDSLVWQGPEINALFSYGPNISTLQYNGIPYLYDNRGKLVAKGTGIGAEAMASNNGIFKSAEGYSQSFILKGSMRMKHSNRFGFSANYINNKESTIFPNNTNAENKVSLALNSQWGNWKINLSYVGASHLFSIANRNGLLNRVYQQASLSPISFDAAQAHTLPNGQQRSYQSLADNPYFLLENNGDGYKKKQSVFGLTLQRSGKVKLEINQSFETINQHNSERYQPSTAYFPNGIFANRKQQDQGYFLSVATSYERRKYLHSFGGLLNHYFQVNGSLNINKTTINYSSLNQSYMYSRNSGDFVLSYSPSYKMHNWYYIINLSDNPYLSSTATKQSLWLPSISGLIKRENLFNNGTSIKLTLANTHFTHEPSFTQSLAYTSLLGLTSAQSMQYFPTTEVNGFYGLSPIKGVENKVNLAVSFNRNIWDFSGEYYTKHISNDVFPYLTNGSIKLGNLASHTTNGIELVLAYNKYKYGRSKVSFSSQISFNSFNTRVTDVENGMDVIKVGGFSNIYKALIKGQPIGEIMGTTYLRNQNNQLVIGNDGFPLVDTVPKQIGNPNPNFYLKFSSALQWKGFTFGVEWEWRDGGDVWNGTQAALDYYGRSRTSGEQRNVTNYVFQGVDQQGNTNYKAVSFYDANLPVSQNRWVRYGPAGVGEAYIQKGSYLKLHTVRVGYRIMMPNKSFLQTIQLALSAQNLLVWSPYKGADPSQLLMDMPNGAGLDYFNIPSTKLFTFNIAINF